jgi:hypothetical protein
MTNNPLEEEKTATGTLMELVHLAPASIIRTETVLSKLPIHNLAKKGNINIHIVRKGTDGQVELSWRVSPSRDYGEPRQLAYKLDTLIVNRRIEEQGRPLPAMVALGSIRQICRDLGINEGKGSNDVKRAILQNSSAFISAKLTYKGNDGTVRRLDANFARYSVIFTGEKLPDGRTADGVYLILNDPYREVLNNAPVRPLNYDYLRELPPTHQRFYEIVSYRIFAALKFHQDEARLSYSEYCTYSAHQRYPDRDRFKKQMYKIHRPHLASGYLKAVRFQDTQDAEGNLDWNMFYVPGPKARAEYHTFSNAGRLPEAVVEAPTQQEEGSGRLRPPALRRRAAATRQRTLQFGPVTADAPLLAEFTKRGVSERRAKELLAAAPDPAFIADQIEWGDYLIANSRERIANPPGFFIHLVSERIAPPETFVTTRRRKARAEAIAAQDQARQRQLELEDAYRDYRKDEIDRHLANDGAAAEFDRLARAKTAARHKDFPNLPAETIRQMAEREARSDMAERIPTLLSFEDFSRRQNAGAGETAPATLA